MKDFDRNFRRMQTFVHVFIGVVFVAIIGWWIALAVIAYKAVSTAGEQDWSAGVKPVIEKMWCGKPGCLG